MIHFIWLGSDIPAYVSSAIDAWSMLGDVKVWTERPSFKQPIKNLWDAAPNVQSQSDILRYWIMANVGGIYVDTDTAPIKPIDDIFDTREAFVAECITERGMKYIANSFIGASRPNLPEWVELLDSHCRKALEHLALMPPGMPFHLGMLLEEFGDINFCRAPMNDLSIMDDHYGRPIASREDAYLNHYPTWVPEEPQTAPKIKTQIITAEQEQHRIDTCNSCEFLSGERCAKCGCSGRHRSRIATVHCPIGKW